jgi:hypothetical protein
LTGVDEQGMVKDEKFLFFGFRNAKTKDAWVVLLLYKMLTLIGQFKSLLDYDVPRPFSVYSLFTPVAAQVRPTKEKIKSPRGSNNTYPHSMNSKMTTSPKRNTQVAKRIVQYIPTLYKLEGH